MFSSDELTNTAVLYRWRDWIHAISVVVVDDFVTNISFRSIENEIAN
jgi:hypothetical protein